MHRVEKLFGALRDEVCAVDIGKRYRLPCTVVDLALIGMRGPFELVGGLPEVQKAASLIRCDATSILVGFLAWLARSKVPLADVVCGVSGFAKFGCERDRIRRETGAIAPDAVLVLVLPGEEPRAGRSAHRLVGDVRPEECHAEPWHRGSVSAAWD